MFTKRGCAYRSGDDSGNTYDSDGNVCAKLSSDDKIFIIVAAVFCSLVMLGVGAVYLRQYLRSRAKDRHLEESTSGPLMSSMASPLIPHHYRSSVALLSPTLSMAESYHSAPSSPSSSSSGHGSPYSPNPENFHFPILSADGHLLPPAVPSARRSAHGHSPELAADERPLPSPPLPFEPAPAVVSPRPQSQHSEPAHSKQKRWAYQPPAQKQELVGLYPGVVGAEYYDNYDLERTSVSSPKISRVAEHEYDQPHTALVYRSLSSESEVTPYSYGEDDGYRRY